MLHSRNEDAITLVYTNINSFFIYKSLDGCQRERERERERVGLLWFSPQWDTYLENLTPSSFFDGKLIQDRLLNSGLGAPPPRASTQNGWLTSLCWLPTPTDRHNIFSWYAEISLEIHMAFLLSLMMQLYILFLKSDYPARQLFICSTSFKS